LTAASDETDRIDSPSETELKVLELSHDFSGLNLIRFIIFIDLKM